MFEELNEYGAKKLPLAIYTLFYNCLLEIKKNGVADINCADIIKIFKLKKFIKHFTVTEYNAENDMKVGWKIKIYKE